MLQNSTMLHCKYTQLLNEIVVNDPIFQCLHDVNDPLEKTKYKQMQNNVASQQQD